MTVEHLNQLRGCELHITHIPTTGDEAGLRKLGVNLTSDPDFSSKSLFITRSTADAMIIRISCLLFRGRLL